MTTIIVTGTYSDGAGNPMNGQVTFTPVVTGTDGTVVFLGDPVTARVTNGQMSKTLQTTDTWTVPGAVTYKVVEKVGSSGRVRFFVSLPSTLGPTVDMSSLIQYSNPPNQLQIDATSPVDFTSHLAVDHGPITTEFATVDGRLDALEAAGGVFYELPVDGIPQSDLDAATEAKLDGAIPKTIADAKGDLIAGSAADTVARLGVGANDTVLTADSAQPTGLKWSPSGGAVHTHVIADTTNLQTEIDDLAADVGSKSDAGHSHTSGDITTELTLAQLPPNSVFVINWVSSEWRYDGVLITSRPSARGDLRMWAVGGTTPPAFAVTHDMHSPEVI